MQPPSRESSIGSFSSSAGRSPHGKLTGRDGMIGGAGPSFSPRSAIRREKNSGELDDRAKFNINMAMRRQHQKESPSARLQQEREIAMVSKQPTLCETMASGKVLARKYSISSSSELH
eukprot:CAMPEP_0178989200 /NCGR_PEP_ID=MMETSP0795-20121207/4230_1 /TAXON_ID=88552 /ORGANISM="Amoebophrya sp., Strain Ameob2" /LENGTH=117 /DNA_ID=CAMNT_0020680551 /DNA_START=46 /DNA_END=396 /DNA_ORIENTATION=+